MFFSSIFLLLLPSFTNIVTSIFNHKLDSDSTPYSRSLSFEKSWNSSECQRFYNNKYFSTIEDVISCNTEKTTPDCPTCVYTKWFNTLEGQDKRWTCKKEEITHHRDVIIGHRHKIIFVNVTKSASSTIRELLFANFRIFDRRDEGSIKTISMKDINDYFIFTFVRDPLLRMESGIGQAQRSGVRFSHPEILNFLSQGCVMDKHVWSISRYLNIKLADGSPIKYDFIGSLENIDEDMSLLLPILKMNPAARKKELKLSKKASNVKTLRVINAGAKYFHSSLDYNDSNISKKMCQLIMQDYACLGSQYSPPPMCLP